MIRQLVLCIAVVGSQIAGQAVCHCHAAAVHGDQHHHDLVHQHPGFPPHRHRTTPGHERPAGESPLHHDCDCHQNSPELLVQRAFRMQDDVASAACLSQPIVIATISLAERDALACELESTTCLLSARAHLGIWRL